MSENVEKSLRPALEIRAALPADKERWLLLWQGYLDFYQTELSTEQSALTWQRILDYEFNMKCAVAIKDGLIVGFTTYNLQNSTWSKNGHCYLEDLFVDADARGSGIGRALIEYVKSYAIENRCSRLYWNTDEDNATARKLYDSYTLESGKRQYRIPLN
ncbi:MAG: GNAT family N-acetyltransferase [Candidatus Planktophila sp.]|nr:GNAT family N-acetyltransferase [Candidatus Planktophila sp.]MSO24895.1 GNAT family N-acetyltransferase [Candidatus Planktophila sp.]PHX69814.1 MAG: GNAT family N-acetyltransferase [Actinomycetota bacterium]